MRAVRWALLAVAVAALVAVAGWSTMSRETVVVMVTAAFVVQAVTTFMYGVLAPWWLTRTGRGFFAKSCALTLVLGMYLWSMYAHRAIPYSVQVALWALLIVAIGWGVLWNMVYMQFVEHRPDRMGRKGEHVER